MSLGIGNKYEMRRRALLDVIRICGGVTLCSKLLKISRTRLSNWCNKPEITIPYNYVLLMHHYTGVSIERLAPFEETINKIMRDDLKKKPHSIYMALNEILIGDHVYLKHVTQAGQIIVGTDGVLISGFSQIERYKASGIKKVLVILLDLEALLLEQGSIMEMNINLLITEQVAIGLRTEKLLGNRQGQRNDLRSRKEGRVPLCRIGNNTTEVTSDKVARLIGLPSKDSYYRAKQVYLRGNSELTDKLNQHDISITMAAKQVQKMQLG